MNNNNYVNYNSVMLTLHGWRKAYEFYKGHTGRINVFLDFKTTYDDAQFLDNFNQKHQSIDKKLQEDMRPNFGLWTFPKVYADSMESIEQDRVLRYCAKGWFKFLDVFDIDEKMNLAIFEFQKEVFGIYNKELDKRIYEFNNSQKWLEYEFSKVRSSSKENREGQ